MKLSSVAHGRDNNFNLIRFVAAYAVLVTHSFALAIGTSDAEPLGDQIGLTMGSIAVHVFFVTSGFLVTASLLRRQSMIEFVWARALRIVPALFVMLSLTVLVLGPLFTVLPWYEFLFNETTARYFTRNLFLFAGVMYELPGVFELAPFGPAVNGSLWTMPHEVRLYAILAIVWLAVRSLPIPRSKALNGIILFSAALSGVSVCLAHFGLGRPNPAVTLFFMFFYGSAIYVMRDSFQLKRSYFWIAVCVLLCSIADKQVFFVVYLMTMPYLLFYLAYVPGGKVRRFNDVGDFSYGIYIYAFPIQQSIAVLMPGVSVPEMVAYASIATLLLAILSWHLIEKHALALKGTYVARTRRVLKFSG